MKTIEFNSSKNLNNYLKHIPTQNIISILVYSTNKYVLECA